MPETLYIGSNVDTHDSAIFVIDQKKREVFGMSTERITRYKHDRLLILPVLQEFLRYWQKDRNEVKKVILSHNFTSRQNIQVRPCLHELMLAYRDFLSASSIKDFNAKDAAFRKTSRFQKAVTLLNTKGGLKLLRYFLQGKIENQVAFHVFCKKKLKKLFPNATVEIRPYDHHLTHAVGSYVLCPFQKALLVTIDGWGDDVFSKAFVADGSMIKQLSQSDTIHIPSEELPESVFRQVPRRVFFRRIFNYLSIGNSYSILTWLLGFEPVSDEGKVEALAAFGDYDNELYDKLLKTVEVDYRHDRMVINAKETRDLLHNVEQLNRYVEELGREQVAAAAQKFLETVVLDYVHHLVKKYNIKNICLSGGIAANVSLNKRIFEEVSENIFVMPAMADDGTALGSILLSMMEDGYSYHDFAWLKDREMPYFGNSWSREDIRNALESCCDKLVVEDLKEEWPEKVAELIVQGNIGAVYQGRMEWGPRALGNRSIVASAMLKETKDRINLVIKKRPRFQPLCPSILAEEKERLFERAYLNKHMTCAFQMKKAFWEVLPSAIHIDGTARVQFVTSQDNPTYWRLIKKVKDLTGFGVIVNTSFNRHGRTIVNTPKDAIVDFLDSGMDFAVLEGFMVTRANV